MTIQCDSNTTCLNHKVKLPATYNINFYFLKLVLDMMYLFEVGVFETLGCPIIWGCRVGFN